MSVIYAPAGKAGEYSPLACNLYRGCPHGCLYCYAPAILRMKREQFGADCRPRPGILEALAKDAQRLVDRTKRVLFCFTSDPYQAIEAECRLTRQALEIMRTERLPVSVLTKNGALAERDFDLLADMDGEFGVSLSWEDDAQRRIWEPNAGTVGERLHALERAKSIGIPTWASVEPVVNVGEALAAIRALMPVADMIKVGKWNHAKDASITPWPLVAAEALTLLAESGHDYYIKDDLWNALPEEHKEAYPRYRRKDRT